jgi:hypothetical protein
VPTGRFQCPQVCIKGLSQKQIGSADSPPPGTPPVQGSWVWSAEGLPSTRDWPFRCPPLPPTSPPHVIPKHGNVIHQLVGAVVLGGGAAPTAPPLAGSGRSCASSIRLAKKNARCPCLPGLARKAWPGWLSYAACSREGQEEEQITSSVVPPRGSCPSMTTEPLGQMFIFHGTSDVANRNHRPWITYGWALDWATT